MPIQKQSVERLGQQLVLQLLQVAVLTPQRVIPLSRNRNLEGDALVAFSVPSRENPAGGTGTKLNAVSKAIPHARTYSVPSLTTFSLPVTVNRSPTTRPVSWLRLPEMRSREDVAYRLPDTALS